MPGLLFSTASVNAGSVGVRGGNYLTGIHEGCLIDVAVHSELPILLRYFKLLLICPVFKGSE